MKPYIVRHGEVVLKQITALPKGVELVKEVKREIVAHSETGHHHVLESMKEFKIFTLKGDTYVEVPEYAELWHQKTGKDVHKAHKIVPGIYKINIKTNFNYFSKAMERVRD